MWYMHDGTGWGWMIGMGLMMVAFWGGLILLAFWLLRSSMRPEDRRRTDGEDHDRPSRNALDILKERYARGEISRDEFEQMRDDPRA